MQVLIVYESVFGNTHQVAGAIAQGIQDAAAGTAVNCVPVAGATSDLVAAADLLVVGGPTHARGMTSARSRNDAVQGVAKKPPQAGGADPLDPDATGPGLRTWFHTVPKADTGRRAAAFDTRLGYRLAGGAAKGIARRLREHGYKLAAGPEGFIVDGGEGPMHAGELNRAHDWGAALAGAGVSV